MNRLPLTTCRKSILKLNCEFLNKRQVETVWWIKFQKITSRSGGHNFHLLIWKITFSGLKVRSSCVLNGSNSRPNWIKEKKRKKTVPILSCFFLCPLFVDCYSISSLEKNNVHKCLSCMRVYWKKVYIKINK